MTRSSRPTLRSDAASIASRVAFVALLACGAFAPRTAFASPATAPSVETAAAQLDRLFAAAYPAGEPGAAVIAVRAGETVLRRGYGRASLELPVPIVPESVFRIGSLTKQFTAATVFLLAAEGKLDLGAQVSTYLPDYPAPGGLVTLEQLLTHTSGVPNYTAKRSYWEGIRRDVTPAELIALFKDEPLDFPPGSRFAYSNSNYVLLGAILEKLTGKPYGELVAERIFTPLGMVDSRYDDPRAVVPGRAAGYQGEPGAWDNAAFISPSQAFSAGGLLSTVDDLARWDAALSTDALLPRPWRDRLWTPTTLPDGRPTRYGGGFAVSEVFGHRVVEHAGGIPGFLSHAVRLPDDRVYVAVLSNRMAEEPDPSALALEAALLLVGETLANHPGTPVGPAALAGLAGKYAIAGDPAGPWTITVENGHLQADHGPEGKAELRALSDSEFFFPRPARVMRLRFLRAAGGTVREMVVIPRSGPDETAARTGG
jgi:CubicO group peptidase (beta-lactamase class C family)